MSHKFNPIAITCLIFLIAATQATAAFNNYSMLFDGTNEYVNIGTPPSLDLSGEMSAFAWIKPNNVTTRNFPLGSGNSAGALTQYYINIGEFNNEILICWSNPTLYWDVSSANLQAGQWYLIGFTRSGSTSNWTSKIYIDGVLDETGTTVENPPAQQDFSIGRPGAYSGLYYDGNIDEVSIWNKGLSSNEVSEIYNNGYPGNLLSHSAQTNLVSWWRMGDGGTWTTSWAIPDQKGTNTGTSVNMEESDRSTDALSPPIPSGTTFMAR